MQLDGLQLEVVVAVAQPAVSLLCVVVVQLLTEAKRSAIADRTKISAT